MADIAELTIESWRTSPYGPGLDPSLYTQWQNIAPTQTPSDAGFFSGGQGEEAFVAPPLPPVLAPPPALAPLAEVVVGAARNIIAPLAPIIALFRPTPTGADPDVSQLAPLFAPITDYVEALPEVLVTGRAPPKPPKQSSPFADAPLPPNWADMLDWRRPLNLFTYMFPLGGPIGDAVSDRRDDAAPGTPRSDPTSKPIATVTVTGKRRAPVFIADPIAPLFRVFPIVDPVGFPIGDPFAEPLAAPRAKPSPRTKPAPGLDLRDFTRNAPLDDLLNPFLDPIGDAIASPFTPTRPGDDVRTPTRPTPGLPDPDIFAPTAPAPSFDPLASPTFPPNKADNCNCTEKKKPKKKKKPRTVCYRGTYTEKSKSLSKSRKEQVPCQ